MKEQFTEIIKSKDLHDITIDLVEKVLDNEITNEVLKEIPVLKSLVAVKNIYTSLYTSLLIKSSIDSILKLYTISLIFEIVEVLIFVINSSYNL